MQIANETNTKNDVNIWLQNVKTGQEVPGSRYVGKINPQTQVPIIINQPKFKLAVKAKDSYRLLSQSNIKDGFYVDSKIRAYPLIDIICETKEIQKANT